MNWFGRLGDLFVVITEHPGHLGESLAKALLRLHYGGKVESAA